MGLKVVQKGDFSKTDKFFEKCLNLVRMGKLDQYGRQGVAALAAATPVGTTGKTAASWRYEVVNNKDTFGVNWYNENENDGVNIAILLQYGHATGNGAYVQGIDYINPAMRAVFDDIADGIWKEVTD